MGSDTHGSPPRRELDDVHRVRAYASCVVVSCSPDRVTDVTRFDVGENHAVYKLSYLDAHQEAQHVVIRIASSDRARDWAAAGREATVLKKVQGFAAPLLHDFRCDGEWFDSPAICMRFVQGEQRAPRDAQDFERLDHTVGWVHALPTEDLAELFPVAATTKGYFETRLKKIAEKLPSIRDPLPATVQKRLWQALALMEGVVEGARSAASFGTGESLVLLHGDVAGGNIVWTRTPSSSTGSTPASVIRPRRSPTSSLSTSAQRSSGRASGVAIDQAAARSGHLNMWLIGPCGGSRSRSWARRCSGSSCGLAEPMPIPLTTGTRPRRESRPTRGGRRSGAWTTLRACSPDSATSRPRAEAD